MRLGLFTCGYQRYPLEKAFADAKRFGYDYIELWGGYPHAFVGDLKLKTTAHIRELIDKYGIPVECFTPEHNGYPYNYMMGDEIQWERSMMYLEDAIDITAEIGAKKMLISAGHAGYEAKDMDIMKRLMKSLRRLTEYAEQKGVTIVLEALNSLYDHKGYYLDSSYVGFEIMKAVDCPNIKLLYDCYHMQLMEGNLVNSIRDNIDYIGHFHSAGVPGRHELHLGETNYPFVIKAADDAGYDRYFGFEYWPTYDNKQSLTDILNYVRG